MCGCMKWQWLTCDITECALENNWHAMWHCSFFPVSLEFGLSPFIKWNWVRNPEPVNVTGDWSIYVVHYASAWALPWWLNFFSLWLLILELILLSPCVAPQGVVSGEYFVQKTTLLVSFVAFFYACILLLWFLCFFCFLSSSPSPLTTWTKEHFSQPSSLF